MSKKLRNVVLVDDNETTSFLNNRLLSRLDVADRVYTFTRAEQAYDFLWGSGDNEGSMALDVPQLVFVDLKMPGMDGFEFLEQYSQLPETVKEKTVLAVLTTSMHSADTARVAKFAGVEYLAKPLTEEKMQKLLKKRFVEN
ncbi:Response regulator receiver domain-containing protein [Hymenobacter daecheongensis DSM 21074]|uniref:Response regulator receiver domain-containing protein n=1 Tax=Hymenobacter daecheongensis DSM 21074 TaxID=1121955 RepID=A0A1M6GV80_9BACT|nr:response regulator [Hymenobacter daecheongensis]SHJ13873.1 Response regulator receiver domain-containing protein [Hymenobacter daecheongensis DSM 21074]